MKIIDNQIGSMQTMTNLIDRCKMKFWILGVLVSVVTLLGSGCVVSRTAENLWAIGGVEYYADFSQIENHTVYESNGEYYMKIKVTGCQPDPKLIGIIAPLCHFVEYKEPIAGAQSSLWVKVSSDTKEYLCTRGDANADDMNPDSFSFSTEPDFKMTQQPVNAISHPVVRDLRPIEIMRSCCGDNIQNSQLVYKEKRLASYWLLPIVIAGVAWDVPATIVMSTYFDFILIPNILIAEVGKSMLGVEDRKINHAENSDN